MAAAAPAMLQPKTATKSQSSTIFVTPAATVTYSPNFGLPEVAKRHWNSYCKIENGRVVSIILPYSTESESSLPSAPKSADICGKKIIPIRASTVPIKAAAKTTSENVLLAFSFSPSPKFLAISAPPPVPNIKPMQPSIISTGIMKLTAAKGVLPA